MPVVFSTHSRYYIKSSIQMTSIFRWILACCSTELSSPNTMCCYGNYYGTLGCGSGCGYGWAGYGYGCYHPRYSCRYWNYGFFQEVSEIAQPIEFVATTQAYNSSYVLNWEVINHDFMKSKFNLDMSSFYQDSSEISQNTDTFISPLHFYQTSSLTLAKGII